MPCYPPHGGASSGIREGCVGALGEEEEGQEGARGGGSDPEVQGALGGEGEEEEGRMLGGASRSELQGLQAHNLAKCHAQRQAHNLSKYHAQRQALARWGVTRMR